MAGVIFVEWLTDETVNVRESLKRLSLGARARDRLSRVFGFNGDRL